MRRTRGGRHHTLPLGVDMAETVPGPASQSPAMHLLTVLHRDCLLAMSVRGGVG